MAQCLAAKKLVHFSNVESSALCLQNDHRGPFHYHSLDPTPKSVDLNDARTTLLTLSWSQTSTEFLSNLVVPLRESIDV